MSIALIEFGDEDTRSGRQLVIPLSEIQLMRTIECVVSANLSELTRKTVVWLLAQSRGVWAVRLFVPFCEACRLHTVPRGCYEAAPLQGPSGLNRFLGGEKTSMRFSRRIVWPHGYRETVSETHGWTLWLADRMWEEEAFPLTFDWSLISQVDLSRKKKS
jgi:hypothetical protein